MEVKEESGGLEILKDQENMEGSEVAKEEGMNTAAEIGSDSKRKRNVVNYCDESEDSDGLCKKNGGKKRNKKALGRKHENNGVGEEKKKSVGKREKLGLVKKEEDGEMRESGGNVGEREDLQDMLCEEEEKAGPRVKKEEKGEDVVGEEEEGNGLEKDNNNVGEQENEEMSVLRTRKSSRKTKENRQKLNIVAERKEDEGLAMAKRGRGRRRKTNNAEATAPVEENCENGKTMQGKLRSHSKDMEEGEREGLGENGERLCPSKGKRVMSKDENVSRI